MHIVWAVSPESHLAAVGAHLRSGFSPLSQYTIYYSISVNAFSMQVRIDLFIASCFDTD